MFKRANKVTALLVAAASVMATVPAMAADTVRLGNKEGTVKQGIAYGDGSYAYYGYRTDSDDTGVYYNNDGGATKEKLDSDLEDYRLDNVSKYGTKYAYAKESSNEDEYLVDLSNGKVDTDESLETKSDNAKSQLINNIKKADRYEGLITKTSDFDNLLNKTTGAATTFEQILRGQFGDTWYQYSVTTDSAAKFTYVDAATNATTTTAAKYIGFTNEKGKYIDLSQETNIRVFSTKTGRAEWIKEYGDEDSDAKIKVDLVDVKAVAQDKDNIYAVTTVKVTDRFAIENNIPASNRAPEYQYFLQKISKTQGGKDDNEAYTSKEITSYQLQQNTVAGKIYDEDKFGDAYDMLMGHGDQGKEALLGVTVKDNSLYVVRMEVNLTGNDTEIDSTGSNITGETEKLHVYKLDMGKFKKEANFGTLNKDVDFNALKKDDDMDDGDVQDFKFIASPDGDAGITGLERVEDSNTGDYIKVAGQNLYRMPSVSIDTTGVVWALEDRKIIKIDKLDKKTAYTVDGDIEALDVYDENNLIAWEIDGEIYTNISEGKKQTADEGLVVNPAQGQATTTAQAGWVQDTTTGAWTFYDLLSGVKQASYWVYDNGTYYWIKADGTMATGWAQDTTGTWYYLNPTSGNQGKALGAMLTGWQQVGGAWYYMTGSGAMAANTTIDGYYVGANGAWVQ